MPQSLQVYQLCIQKYFLVTLELRTSIPVVVGSVTTYEWNYQLKESNITEKIIFLIVTC
jgi:hypothetical protein